jgi:hypothetical protein
MTYPIHWALEDSRPDDPPATIQLVAQDEPILLEIESGHIAVRPATTAPADLTIAGHPDAIMALFLGRIPVSKASEFGIAISGRSALLRRVVRTTPHPALASLLPD